MPQRAQGELAADVPELQVHVGQGDGGDILADCRDRSQLGLGLVGVEERFDLFVEGGLAGVVEAEEDDGIFCWCEKRGGLVFVYYCDDHAWDGSGKKGLLALFTGR